MIRQLIRKTSLMVLLSTIFIGAGTAQDDLFQLKLRLDLNDFSLNNMPIKELTPEKVRNLLGEPSLDDYSWKADITGPRIFFHHDGLIFWFHPKNTDPEQKLISMTVYMIDAWDMENADFFAAFEGKTTPDISCDHRVDDIIQLFNKKRITIQSAADVRIERLKSYGDTSLFHYDLIWIEDKNGSLCFSCDEVTKYLDYLTINF